VAQDRADGPGLQRTLGAAGPFPHGTQGEPRLTGACAYDPYFTGDQDHLAWPRTPRKLARLAAGALA